MASCNSSTSVIYTTNTCNESAEVITTVCDDQPYDHITHAVPPGNSLDFFYAVPKGWKSEAGMFQQRLMRRDMWLIFLSIIFVIILSVVIVMNGTYNGWYSNLIRPDYNPWVIRFLWGIFTIVSYGAIFVIWKPVKQHETPLDNRIACLYLIGNLLTLMLITVVFYCKNLALGCWLSILVFIYWLWLCIHIWHINAIAGVFLVPILFVYAFLIYNLFHIAELNNINIT